MITDKGAIESAKKLSEYCESHESCIENGCVFHSKDGIFGGCVLKQSRPEFWRIKED